jgi:hypothetical protein
MERPLVAIVKVTDFEFDPPLPKLTFVLEKEAALEGTVLDWNDRFTSPEPLPELLVTVTVYVAVSPLIFSAEDGLTETELTYGKAHAPCVKKGPAKNAEETRVNINANVTVMANILVDFLLLLLSCILWKKFLTNVISSRSTTLNIQFFLKKYAQCKYHIFNKNDCIAAKTC